MSHEHVNSRKAQRLVSDLLGVVALSFSISTGDVLSTSRQTAPIVRARSAACYLLSSDLGWSTRAIGEAMGWHNKSAHNGIHRAAAWLADPAWAAQIERIRRAW